MGRGEEVYVCVHEAMACVSQLWMRMKWCIFIHCKWTRNMGGSPGKGARDGWVEVEKRGKAREKREGEGRWGQRSRGMEGWQLTVMQGRYPPLPLVSLPPSTQRGVWSNIKKLLILPSPFIHERKLFIPLQTFIFIIPFRINVIRKNIKRSFVKNI